MCSPTLIRRRRLAPAGRCLITIAMCRVSSTFRLVVLSGAVAARAHERGGASGTAATAPQAQRQMYASSGAPWESVGQTLGHLRVNKTGGQPCAMACAANMGCA
eukprot:1133966-Pelagomonas_calceolata.AAC.2